MENLEMVANSIDFEKAKFKLENGILFCQFFNMDKSHRLYEETTHLYIGAMITLCNGIPTPFIIDVRNATGTYTITAAKLLAHSPELKLVKVAEAYVVNSTRMKLLINSYKRIYEPLTPFVIVDNNEQAISYCLNAKRNYD